MAAIVPSPIEGTLSWGGFITIPTDDAGWGILFRQLSERLCLTIRNARIKLPPEIKAALKTSDDLHEIWLDQLRKKNLRQQSIDRLLTALEKNEPAVLAFIEKLETKGADVTAASESAH